MRVFSFFSAFSVNKCVMYDDCNLSKVQFNIDISKSLSNECIALAFLSGETLLEAIADL